MGRGAWQCLALGGGSLGPGYPAPVGEGCSSWILQDLKFAFCCLVVLVGPTLFCSQSSFPCFPSPQSQTACACCGARAVSRWTFFYFLFFFQKRWHLVRSLLALRHFITRPFWLHAVLVLAWNWDLLLPHTRPQTEALLKRRCKKGSASERYQKEAAREFLPLLMLHLRVCSVLGPYVTRAPGGLGDIKGRLQARMSSLAPAQPLLQGRRWQLRVHPSLPRLGGSGAGNPLPAAAWAL